MKRKGCGLVRIKCEGMDEIKRYQNSEVYNWSHSQMKSREMTV